MGRPIQTQITGLVSSQSGKSKTKLSGWKWLFPTLDPTYNDLSCVLESWTLQRRYPFSFGDSFVFPVEGDTFCSMQPKS